MRWLRDGLLWAKDRIKGYRTYKEVAEHTKTDGRAEIPIRFLGLWDTVEAYGMPVEELKRGIDWVLWPLLFGDLIRHRAWNEPVTPCRSTMSARLFIRCCGTKSLKPTWLPKTRCTPAVSLKFGSP